MKAKNHKTLLFFIFFSLILVKVSAFHVYDHAEDKGDKIENCATCEIAIETQQSQFEFSNAPLIPAQKVVYLPYDNPYGEITVLQNKHLLFSIYSRPPPVLV